MASVAARGLNHIVSKHAQCVEHAYGQLYQTAQPPPNANRDQAVKARSSQAMVR
jgi:hypothetical protein